jgi:chorismate-pyruvate lyase
VRDPIGSYFVAQARRPSDVRDVETETLAPYHRALLVNDGMVTRFVEASVLEPVAVDVLEQGAVDAVGCGWLDLRKTSAAVLRRRVAIHGRESRRLYVLAESLLVTSRLPRRFAASLAESGKGLGELIEQEQLETRRELLWFGCATTPAWAEAVAPRSDLLTRSYRVVVGDRPAILISESFPLADPTAEPS